MKKFYFLIASLFIAMGAMAQGTVTAYINVENGATDTGNGTGAEKGTIWESSKITGLTMKAVDGNGNPKATIEAAGAGYYYLCLGAKPYSVSYTVSVPENGGYKITGFSMNYRVYASSAINFVCEAADIDENYSDDTTGVIEADGLDTYSFSFTISETTSGQNNGLGAESFVVYLEKEPAEPVISHTLTVGDAGWATLYLGFDAVIPATVEAYTVSTVGSDYARLEAATGVLAANTGILVKAAAGNYDFAYTTEAADVIESALEGTLFETEISGYVLADGDNGIGFYATEDNFVSKANKAYLPATAMSSAAFYGFLFEGTTGVENVEVENGAQVIFDLTGRRIEAISAPGIYVVNGKKVLVK